MLIASELAWEKMNGLIPAIVQDAFSGRVLMQAYMNREALDATLSSGLATFHSRSRNSLWVKGETSGNHLEVVSVSADCDGDCLLVLANPKGPACHLGLETCFDTREKALTGVGFLAELESVISHRKEEKPEGSYTTRLFESGTQRIAQKVGEEGVETALAGVSGDEAELLNEAADLVFHLMVLLRERETSLAELTDVLRSRHSK